MTVETAQPTLMARADLGLPTPYVAPDGKLETVITKIFADVFGIDQVGANDDFFDIGGDSLVAETISMEILQRTGCEFPMSSLLDYGSPRRIAAALRRSEPGKDAAKAPIVAEAKTRPPIFVVHGRRGYTMPTPQFLQALAEGQKLRMFELPGIRGGQSYDRIEDIADAYIGQLTAEYPEGPILLASFCAGGLIALEMAARLAEKGRPVKHLVLIDPPIRKNGTLGFGASPIHLDLLHRTKTGASTASASALAPSLLRPEVEQGPTLDEFRARPVDRGAGEALCRLRRLLPSSLWRAGHNSRVLPPHAADAGWIACRQILPNRTIHLVFDQHKEVTSEPRAAELMQEAFDAALAEG